MAPARQNIVQAESGIERPYEAKKSLVSEKEGKEKPISSNHDAGGG